MKSITTTTAMIISPIRVGHIIHSTVLNNLLGEIVRRTRSTSFFIHHDVRRRCSYMVLCCIQRLNKMRPPLQSKSSCMQRSVLQALDDVGSILHSMELCQINGVA